MTLQNKRLMLILACIPILLLIPLVAMQYTTEVNWSGLDFAVMGFLLLMAGLSIELVLRKIHKRNYQLIIFLAVLILFFIIWAELAVGIFDSPFAGS